jgi:hypothetical protein
VREAQADVPGVLRLAERLPLRILDRFEYLGEVARLTELPESFEAEHLRVGAGDERRVSRRRHVRHLLEQRDVLRMVAELVVADQQTERRAAEHAEFPLVDLLEHGALVELGGPFEILQQILLGDVEGADLQHRPGLALLDEMVQAAPGRFQFLEFRRVHHFVQLRGDERIQLRDPRLDHRLRVSGVDDLPFEHLLREIGDDVAGEGALSGLGGARDVLQDLVEKRDFLGSNL